MADVRHQTTAGYWFRYLLRAAGIAAAFVAVFCSVYVAATPGEGEYTGLTKTLFTVGSACTVIALVWLAVEVIMGLVLVTGSRAAASGNVYLQIALAAVFFLVVNAIAIRNYSRYDCTRGAQFTLAPDLVKELRTLSNSTPTDVVVLKLHKSAINRGEDADNIDKAAETKVVEKVNDLVDQLRELGPRFNVKVLDKQDEYFLDQVDKLPESLRKAIAAAPEDSIFFHANNRVRRLSFSDFYRVDKSASRTKETVTTPDGKTETRTRTTNLVLLPQGKEEFVKRLLSLEQKTPKIGLLTIHPELSTRESGDEYSSAGLRKSLEANGFEVVDIITKKWGGRGGPVPAAFTYEEYELDRLEARVFQINNELTLLRGRLESLDKVMAEVRTRPLEDLDRIFSRQIRRRIQKQEDREYLLEVIADNKKIFTTAIEERTKELGDTEAKLLEAQKDEKASEGKRISDVQAKLRSAINDCDLLIVPRLTSMDLAKGYVIRPSFYPMPKDQVDAIRDYLKAGKPVLACFGPMNLGPSMSAEADDLEKLFNLFGIEFGTQTLMTDREARAAAERQGESLGSASELPLLIFDTKATGEKKANPINQAFRIAARAVDGKLEVRKSGPRMVTLNPSAANKSKFTATILQTVNDSWNEERPMSDEEYVPKYEPTPVDDPKKGTPEEERRGPFPIGVALETKPPVVWYDPNLAAAQTSSAIGVAAGGLGLAASELLLDPEAFAPADRLPERPTVRIAAFGHGGLFVGKELSPAQEQLLLTTVNWQLGRDELLPRDPGAESRWQFPRAAMNDESKRLWRWGTLLGLPMLCTYLGLIVLMTRRRSASYRTKPAPV